ncbi:hypothetical protein [Megalodesulfovibrio paquesii]
MEMGMDTGMGTDTEMATGTEMVKVTLRCRLETGTVVRLPGQTVAMDKDTAGRLAAAGLVERIAGIDEADRPGKQGRQDKPDRQGRPGRPGKRA